MYAMEQTLHVNPTKEDRKITNSSGVWVFGLLIFVWLIIVIKVLVGAPSQEIEQIYFPTSPTFDREPRKEIDENYQTTSTTPSPKTALESQKETNHHHLTTPTTPSPDIDESPKDMDDHEPTPLSKTSPTTERESPKDIVAHHTTPLPGIKSESSQNVDENAPMAPLALKSSYFRTEDRDYEKDFHPDEDKASKEIHANYLTAIIIAKAMTSNFTGLYVICALLSGLIAVAYIYFLSISKGRIVVDLVVYLLCVWTFIVVIFTAIMLIYLAAFSIFAVILLIPGLVYAAYIVISYLCARGAGVTAIFEIIRDSSRALICSPMILLFTLTISVIIVFISIFTIYIFYRILLSNDGIFIYNAINIFGAMVLICFFVNLNHMIVSGYAVNWFWTRDQHSSSYTIRRDLGKTLNYHLGTICYASIPLVPLFASIFQMCRCRDSEKDIIKIYNIYTRIASQFCVTMYIVDYALVQTSIYGYDFTTAIMAAHDLVAQNNHELNLAVTQVTSLVTMIGSFVISLPFAIGGIRTFAFSAYSPVIPFGIAFTSAIHALLANKMIIHYTSAALQDENESNQKAVSPETPNSVRCTQIDGQKIVIF